MHQNKIGSTIESQTTRPGSILLFRSLLPRKRAQNGRNLAEFHRERYPTVQPKNPRSDTQIDFTLIRILFPPSARLIKIVRERAKNGEKSIKNIVALKKKPQSTRTGNQRWRRDRTWPEDFCGLTHRRDSEFDLESPIEAVTKIQLTGINKCLP